MRSEQTRQHVAATCCANKSVLCTDEATSCATCHKDKLPSQIDPTTEFLAPKGHRISIWFDFVQLVAVTNVCGVMPLQVAATCYLACSDLEHFFSSTGPEMFYNINFLLWIFEQLPVIPSVIPGTSFATMSCIVLSNLKNLKFLCNNQTWCCLRPSKCFQYKSLFKSLTAVSFTTLLDFWLNSEWGTSHLWYCF